MTDLVKLLENIRRPRLLIRAARFGIADYNRERDLKRLTKSATILSPSRAIGSLMAEEARLEDIRVTGEPNYSVSRHVEVLIALMAEATLLPKASPTSL